MSRDRVLLAACTLIVLVAGSPLRALAADPPKVKSPLSPKESLDAIVVSPGLKVELAACEPQVIDPVAIRFDEDGRMWVVEMRDYPTGPADGNPNASRISVLDDRDADGFFETATVFVDGLHFATGVQPWKGGVFVTMAGEVAYIKDTNGDGRADVCETWFTGFAEQNTQLRANDPRLALDNHIYVANGLRGGMVVNTRKPDSKPVSISGMDFRFDPFTGECEAVSGAGQFGMTFDDWGNRFICSNRNPAMHVVLENLQLKKNPLVAVPAVVHDVAKAGDQSRLYPIAESWTTSNLHAGQFTAACGVEIYRGDALPRDYYGNIFTCDPTAHLIHREIMEPFGVTFSSTPAEKGKEFLASRDSWFSPVNLENGPDGALYVVDMYRAVIEHPDWMPEELRKRPDQLDGNDRGRIYRVVPKGRQYGRPPRLAAAGRKELAGLLSHPNAWHRETAARLLLERQDQSVARRLQRLLVSEGFEPGQLLAARLLDALGMLDDELLAEAISVGPPRLMEELIEIAEPRLDSSPELVDLIHEVTDHSDARVRHAAILAVQPLETLVRPADEWQLIGMQIAAGKLAGRWMKLVLFDEKELRANVSDPARLVADVARLAAAANDSGQRREAIEALAKHAAYRNLGLASLLRESARRGVTVEAILAELDGELREQLIQWLDQALTLAGDPNVQIEARRQAVALAVFTPGAAARLAELALEDESEAVRLAAVAALAGQGDLAPWQGLVARFGDQSPALERAMLDGLLSRPERTVLLLDEIAAGRIKPAAIDAARMTQLLEHADKSIRTRAKQILADAIPADRQRVLAEYQTVLTMHGDPQRGREVFAKNCATCHRIGDLGVDIAPDISDSREKTPQQYLTDILQPNRAIDANYFSYTAVTAEGLAHTGILAAETPNSVTLKLAEGKVVTLSRGELEALQPNGVSLMPEGLEREIPPRAMADVIAFIKNWRYLGGKGPSIGPAR